ncbi:MAG TPA: class III extradiol ring-cleavage dioxygenase [Acidimicrobiia bacterium]|nr:class III extradiol ring-cleavage dioxygenase [Acidimicrobiia bacterium]
MADTKRQPTYFLSHGGGPWPWMTGPIRDAMDELNESLLRLPSELPEKPKAILMVSGHWEARHFTVQTNPNPSMFYDYGGFDPELYTIQYPAPGSPALATRVTELLTGAGITVKQDAERGFDHGMYSVLAPPWPDAEIPVVQLAVKQSFDPEEHLAVGRAVAPLRDEGILILGSGFSYHNLRITGPAGAVPSAEFDEWLATTILDSTPAERTARLREWEKAPSARIAQPREDHLIPLMVVVGAAEDEPATRTYYQRDWFGGVTASSFRFGTPLTASTAATSEGAAHV